MRQIAPKNSDKQLANNSFLQVKKTLPRLGVGLGLRREIAEETLAHRHRIDWLEINPENYMGLGGSAAKRLKIAAETFPLISHGLSLSIGSADEINQYYLRQLKTLLDKIDAPWWSDHLCYSSIDKRYLHDLLPLPLTEEAIDHVVQRVHHVQDFIRRPFLLENISYYLEIPGSEMDEATFIKEIVTRADCGLLLDVNNVYVNSKNHNFDAVNYIDKLPLDRVVQLHVAGHKETGERIIDSHGMPVSEPVFELLAVILEKADVHGILLERDGNYPEFSELLTEIERIREITVQANYDAAKTANDRE